MSKILSANTTVCHTKHRIWAKRLCRHVICLPEEFNLKAVPLPNNPSTTPRMLIYDLIFVCPFVIREALRGGLALHRVPGEVGHVSGT